MNRKPNWSDYESGQVIGDILWEFPNQWNVPNSLDYKDFIEDYRVRYYLIKQQRRIARA